MAMKTDTLLMLGGLGLLGFGMFYMMNKSGASAGSFEDKLAAAVAASGAANAAQAEEMRLAIAEASSGLSSNDKDRRRQAEQELTASYVQMGITAVPEIIKTIKGLFEPTPTPAAAG